MKLFSATYRARQPASIYVARKNVLIVKSSQFDFCQQRRETTKKTILTYTHVRVFNINTYTHTSVNFMSRYNVNGNLCEVCMIIVSFYFRMLHMCVSVCVRVYVGVVRVCVTNTMHYLFDTQVVVVCNITRSIFRREVCKCHHT